MRRARRTAEASLIISSQKRGPGKGINMERKIRAWLRPRGRRLAKPKTPEGGKYISLGLRKWPKSREPQQPAVTHYRFQNRAASKNRVERA